ncbi:MAG: endonuclease domain-containing protein [Candidatus Parcubacteria bacterium]|nr:endonuclease domain-containing protein [Candidatus Parcubacteria bacterium]
MGEVLNRKKFRDLRSKLRRESTPPERKLWHGLNAKKLGYKFRRQQGIGNYIVDFFCSELKLVVEVDGIGHEDEEIYKNDKIRERYLTEMGFKVIRYSAHDIGKNLEGVVRDIKNTCDKLSGEVRVLWD